jgi:polygalacturonase
MVSGTNIVIQGGILDGQGAKYWDGLGSNGGVTKPTFFNANLQNSIIRDITLRNTPIQAFAIEGSYIQMIHCTVDNLDGMVLLNGNPIGHNTDGFNLKGSFMSITDSTVCAQDDCAAIIGGNDFAVTNMKCNCATGGLSVVGEGDDVKNVLFQNIVLANSLTGAYVRSVVGTTGSISNITYENIHFSSASEYGIAVQQDYENSGPTGTASSGYEISDIRFSNITGTVGQYGKTIYVICGAGSCKDISLDNVSITGGRGSSCNIAIDGC